MFDLVFDIVLTPIAPEEKEQKDAEISLKYLEGNMKKNKADSIDIADMLIEKNLGLNALTISACCFSC